MKNIADLLNKANFTIFLGKNGVGKSTLLREIDSSSDFNTKYISPERGGILRYDAGVDQNMSVNDNWIINDRRKNRTEQFRQQSIAQFRILEVMVLREIEKNLEKRNNHDYTFDTILNHINELLPKINLKRSDKGFEILDSQNNRVSEDNISSGESELISLSIEILVFSRLEKPDKVLLLDEPDVHLHPDLQHKFIEFVEKIACEYKFKVIIATHSTAIIGAFSQKEELQIIPVKDKSEKHFESFKYNPICNKILPVFGAHPLSSHFNEMPILLVEGEDDKRVFDEIIRASNQEIKFSPVVVGNVNEMSRWETWLDTFLPSIYDNPKAYSIRDLDQSTQTNIENIGCVTRARLNCYSIENFLLTDECLEKHCCSSSNFLDKIKNWCQSNPEHQAKNELDNLYKNFANRRTIKIKDIRNVILVLLETKKPWEVVVSRLLVNNINEDNNSPDSVISYLGKEAKEKIF